MGRFLLEAGKRPASIKLRLNVHMLQSSNDISRISYIANKFYWTLAHMSFRNKIKFYF